MRRADDETRSALALVRGRGDARGADVVPLLAKRSRIFDDVEGVEFKAVALASLVSYQRMAHACFVRPRVAFAHQIVGAKRATHIKFSDSDDDDDERVDGKSGVESDDESSCDEREGEYVLPLNASQRRALRRFFARDGHFDQLQMVQGPPGCGKTHFIVSLLAVLAAKKQRVLVCAPSNKAVCVVMELYLRTCGEDAAPCVLAGAEGLKMNDALLRKRREVDMQLAAQLSPRARTEVRTMFEKHDADGAGAVSAVLDTLAAMKL